MNSFTFSLSKPNSAHFLNPSSSISFEQEKRTILVGSFIQLGYSISEGNKERVQFLEGLVIAKQNRGIGESFTLRRMVQGIGVEQVFFSHSPRIKSLIQKQRFHVRRAKLYFFRSLQGKSAKLRTKF